MATETFTRIYLLNYNNYGNRIVKGISDGAPITTISTYKAADPYHKKYDNINFYRNDGVNTTQTINFGAAESEKDADYLIVVKVTKIDNVETDETIISRWFIIECRYNRRLQMNLTLRRDLIVDYWSAIYTNAVTDGFFCEKGNVSAATDNFIFNNEAMSFNQVLQSGTVMGSGNGYIVGYISKHIGSNVRIFPEEVAIVNSKDDIPVYKQYKEGYIENGIRFSGTVYAMDATYDGTHQPSGRLYYDTIEFSGSSGSNDKTGSIGTGTTIGQTDLETQNLNQAVHSFLVQTVDNVPLKRILEICQILANHTTKNLNMQPYSNWSYVNNSEVYYVASEQKFYKVGISASSSWTSFGVIPPGWESDINAYICSEWTKRYNSSDAWAFPLANGDMGSCPLKGVTMNYKKATVTLTDVSSTYDYGTVPGYSSRSHVNAPYDIFVGEYNSANASAASVIANALIGSGAMYDLQHVPWVPSYSTANTNKWSVQGGTFYWLSSDSVSATEISGISGLTYTASSDIKTLKSDSLTKKWRIVSPNHANAWDFNPAQNRGVSKWYYELTLKPYQPYFHVYPQFGGLYGTNYSNDNRGLVFQGSFSMAVSSSAWSTYQINNASYQDAFNRRIENLSVTQDAQRKMELFGMIAGTVSGATSGGYMGANIGGGAGAAVGALAGGAVSLAAGIADRSINDALRNEAIDYMKDQFGYQLQNIIATPDTLARSSSFDVNNSVFPVLEKYDATSAEKDALLDKIMRNGMSIGRIGTFKEFWNNATSDVGYIKGKLIRMGANTFLDDTHVFNEIANELYKGVYRY